MAASGSFRSIFSTPFGDGVVHASEVGIIKVELPDARRTTLINKQSDSECKISLLTEHAAELLHIYFTGEAVDFNKLPADLSGLSPFRCLALKSIRNIPFGAICTYGQVAVACGSSHAARAVGGAMAANPVPIIIPCHRVIGSSGRLTGFSAPGGEELKMKLLKMERVEFKGLLVNKKSLVMNSWNW
jgi:methylated-DNA-[protein]-cysteine S-methyltransferase